MNLKRLLILALVGIGAYSIVERLIDDDGLLLHYTFEKVDNGSVADATRHQHHGTVIGAKRVAGGKGEGGYALRFDGEDDIVRVPLDIRPQTLPTVTITAWVRPEGEQSRGVIVSNLSESSRPYARAFGISTSGEPEKPYYTTWNEDAGVWDVEPVQSDEWSFIALMYDQGTGKASIYVNGRTANGDGHAREGHDYFLLGGHPAANMNFMGLIDEVRVYDRVLSVQELDDLFKST